VVLSWEVAALTRGWEERKHADFYVSKLANKAQYTVLNLTGVTSLRYQVEVRNSDSVQ